jgi:putative ABC transport system ATP-binding protein
VLADEPSGNLDTRNGEMVMDLLARLHSELEITLVLVTHDEWIAFRAAADPASLLRSLS